jgi:hypothetical protein
LGASDEECAARREAADAAIAGLEQSRLRGARDVLSRSLTDAETAEAPPGAGVAAAEDALRSLCVRAELLAGLETPPEDVERRREHQMRRLVEAMGRGAQAEPGDLEALTLEWLAVGPAEPAAEGALRARFERCVDALA